MFTLNNQDQHELTFCRHVSPGTLRCLTYHGKSRPTDPKTLSDYDIIVTTYAVVLEGSKSRNDPLSKLHFFRIILDEAHEIREQKSQRFRAICALSAERKWAMSGTPIQNKLEDLAALFSFIGYEALGSATAFKRHVLCEQEGSQTGLEKLRAVLGDLCLRRTKNTLTEALPTRCEQLVNLPLGPEEKRLYDQTVRFGPQSSNPFTWLLKLRMICDHGHDLIPNLSLAQFNTAEDVMCFLCHRGLSATSQSEGFGCPHRMLCLECNESIAITLNADGARDECIECSLSEVSSPQQDAELTGAQAETPANYRGPSTKVIELIKNIKNDTSHYNSDPPKHVVFSVWTRMLDLIEVALRNEQITFCRLDGSMPRKKRDTALRNFSDDPNIRVILMSLQAGGVGINLTSASRVHLMEPHWNPMVELQAVDRAHRIGQRRDVHVRKYVIADTIETSIIRLQQKKIKLAKESLDDGRVQIKNRDIRKELIDEIRAEAGR